MGQNNGSGSNGEFEPKTKTCFLPSAQTKPLSNLVNLELSNDFAHYLSFTVALKTY